MAINFSGDGFHTGFFAPLRFEADIHDCEVEGRIPDDLDGSFYRTCIDRRYPQRMPNDIPYNADGAVDLFRFHRGHVDFRRCLAFTAIAIPMIPVSPACP